MHYHNINPALHINMYACIDNLFSRDLFSVYCQLQGIYNTTCRTCRGDGHHTTPGSCMTLRADHSILPEVEAVAIIMADIQHWAWGI